MARHKVGDSYLSDEELRQHYYENWLLMVTLTGAVVSGVATYYLLDPAWEKWLRFTIVIVSSVVGGGIFAYFNQLLLRLVQAGIIIGVIFAIGYVVWSII